MGSLPSREVFARVLPHTFACCVWNERRRHLGLLLLPRGLVLALLGSLLERGLLHGPDVPRLRAATVASPRTRLLLIHKARLDDVTLLLLLQRLELGPPHRRATGLIDDLRGGHRRTTRT